jgi:hypothetical protein
LHPFKVNQWIYLKLKIEIDEDLNAEGKRIDQIQINEWIYLNIEIEIVVDLNIERESLNMFLFEMNALWISDRQDI